MAVSRVRFVHEDRLVWMTELEGAIRVSAQRHTGQADAVEIQAATASDTDLVVYLGSVKGERSTTCIRELELAVTLDRQILPIVGDLEKYTAEAPEPIHPINGVQWTSAEPLAEEIIRHLGLTEPDRRIFLSYLRKEATPLAEQLYDELHRRRYNVFMDRFELDACVRVQQSIHEALHESAFVLLLESPSVDTSRWVEEEVAYAMQHQLGLISLVYPKIKVSRFPIVPPDKRYPLDGHDLSNTNLARSRLTPGALEKVLLRVEQEHADQLRARRERMILDVLTILRDVKRPGTRLSECSILHKAANGSETVIRVCPRPPDPRDLHDLDLETSVRSGSAKGWLFAEEAGYPRRLRVTSWVAKKLKNEMSWVTPGAFAKKAETLLS
jgi:hypothetical protein